MRTRQRRSPRALHIDVSAGEEISSSDTHGGFHGDGISCVALQFPNSQVADAIAANAAWTPLPLDETAQALAYGVTREDGGEVFSAGPYLTDDSGDPLLPGIANGFYRLIDRHSDAGDGQNLLERASLNVTLAVYDADSDTLIFLRNGYLTDIPVGERGQKEIQPIRRGRCPHRPAAQMPRDRRGNGSGESPSTNPTH